MDDPLTSREEADHWFGDPRYEGSSHPDARDDDDSEVEEPFPPERRVRLYLGIARRIRKYPHARGIRHAAIQRAWEARQELRRADATGT